MLPFSSSVHARSMALCFAVACTLVASTAHADSDLKMAYNGNFCQTYMPAQSTFWYSSFGYTVRDGGAGDIDCPIIRDATTRDRLPYILVEAYNTEVPDDPFFVDFQCKPYWMEEDGDGTFRGFAYPQTASAAGYIQFAWNSLSDYALTDGILNLSPGGEGSIAIACDNMRFDDRLIQYYVEEDRF